jgi:hypothetical protein
MDTYCYRKLFTLSLKGVQVVQFKIFIYIYLCMSMNMQSKLKTQYSVQNVLEYSEEGWKLYITVVLEYTL